MRIAVIADTHDRYPASLPGKLRTADEIWHLGDVCAPDTLLEFELLGSPLRVVRGNGDYNPDWPLERRFEVSGHEFLLVHVPPARCPPGVQVVLHGHTHLPRDETDPAGVRWLNPGCITGSRGAGTSFGWLNVEPGRKIEWKLVKL